MLDFIKNHVKDRIKQRKIGIFGVGTMAHVAVDFLAELGITEFVFFDNNCEKWDDNRGIFDPNIIDEHYFILISTVHFEMIQKQLETLGMEEMQDYIWALDLEYYDALICHKDGVYVPDISMDDLQAIECELSEYANVIKINWFDETEFLRYEEDLGFQEIYHKSYNARYHRKIMEYFFACKLLGMDGWDKNNIYIDVGAASSPFVRYLRENKGMEAYAVDLDEGKYSGLSYYIKEDATDMHFQDCEVTGISLQSAFEMFVGKADTEFIREAARVLRIGGKVIISPLYMHREYLSTVSPNWYHSGTADKDSVECIRTDCRGAIPLARFYNAKALNERVLIPAKKYGMVPIIYTLPQDLVEKDGFVYLKFILVLEKRISV